MKSVAGVILVGEETEGVRYRSIHFPFHVVHLLCGGIPGVVPPGRLRVVPLHHRKEVRYTHTRIDARRHALVRADLSVLASSRQQ